MSITSGRGCQGRETWAGLTNVELCHRPSRGSRASAVSISAILSLLVLHCRSGAAGRRGRASCGHDISCRRWGEAGVRRPSTASSTRAQIPFDVAVELHRVSLVSAFCFGSAVSRLHALVLRYIQDFCCKERIVCLVNLLMLKRGEHSRNGKCTPQSAAPQSQRRAT